ncbi:nudix hydrolase [Nannochloropsis gaditana CCMP526]|uniref:Nudix hydrolase n=2 Tax=Nannochloropsis gaditana TaxID=72520 RepID=W7TEB8_9STRA|nr:nudix hydrolase [Nannochloropsis gaditana CCMP526]XP_005856326.1 nudix hydrolase [Nannochloropsis gaditana CCMP526]EKU20029.1 nudix hydrolase [Nannochloropsis gaditana CCMP526]EKU21732.1 nudix hydrolase [Nannochloropsis gaditana CCMP526]EWM21893.1 nudix hydrolase [Nannochloropsis gaditana]|eukprot:XP_005854628.1 nudix hydrolase [Nannochloropsis gaditana CCMP526]
MPPLLPTLSRTLISAACLCFTAPSSFVLRPSSSRPASTAVGMAAQGFCYKYPRPSVTVDTLVFCLDETQMKILLVQRGNEPFKGAWALPGGFVDQDEGLDSAAARELREETALDSISFAQVGTYGQPGRDPRGHTITVAYTAFLLSSEGARAGDDAREAKFFAFGSLPPLAFDHKKIIEETWMRLVVCDKEGTTVVKERGAQQVLCRLPTASAAQVVRSSKPFT